MSLGISQLSAEKEETKKARRTADEIRIGFSLHFGDGMRLNDSSKDFVLD